MLTDRYPGCACDVYVIADFDEVPVLIKTVLLTSTRTHSCRTQSGRRTTRYVYICVTHLSEIANRVKFQYSPEIFEYFENFYHDQKLEEFVKLKHRVLGARWHEEKGQWEVEIERDGQTFTDWCDILMNGSGLLNKWKCESLPSPSDHPI